VQYAWLHPQHAACKVRRMGQLLEVSHSGDDEWLGRPPRAQAAADPQVHDKIQRDVARGRGTYGTRRRTP
jgi:hypothetical protein